MMTIKSTLPEVYDGLLPVFFDTLIPDESHATCADCAMVDADPCKIGCFNPDTTCCTFYPIIPNYLVGGILSDETTGMADARQRMREVIAGRLGVYPHGIYPARIDRYLYEIGRHKCFGKSVSLRCPYYNSLRKGCSVWPYRNAICSTWFCRHQAGFLGALFWQGVKEYVSLLEVRLSRYAMDQLGIDSSVIVDDPYSKIDPGRGKPAYYPDVEDIDKNPITPGKYAKLWGKWAGNEEDFYRRSLAVIQRPDLRPVAREIIGYEHEYRLRDLQGRMDMMITPVIPKRLKRNGCVAVEHIDDEKCIVSVKSFRFESDKTLPRILDYFDGRKTVDDVLAQVKQDERTEIEPDLVKELYLQEYLVEA
jgi:hypothetical protein